jgi:hypothetical protein
MRWYFGSELVICFLSKMFSSAAADSARNHSPRLSAPPMRTRRVFRFSVVSGHCALTQTPTRLPQQAAHAEPAPASAPKIENMRRSCGSRSPSCTQPCVQSRFAPAPHGYQIVQHALDEGHVHRHAG